jgi:putative spermidine/putrescine transport system substrate-binding protein
MDVKKIKYFDKIVPLFITGKLTPDSVIAQGTAPHSVGFVAGADSTEFSKTPTDWMTLIPTIYNADTLGIRPDLVGREIANWKDILDPAFKGKTSILNIPSIGIMDAAMICESAGITKYVDKGNMTKAEIDKTIDFLIKTKKDGQFRAFWKTFDESVNLMASGEVVIQSMWSPAVAAVRSRGIPCTFQPLKEGYRGWGYTLGVMKHVDGLKLDCFYEYMNWYTSGFEGAFIARQGYYSAQPENAKKYLTEAEYDYWYGGKPAATDILSPFGKLMEKAGKVRDGGDIWQRLGNIAVWNSVMDEDRYLTRRWNEFITS